MVEPWLFERNIIILAELEEELDHAQLMLVKTPLWIQVHGVPYIVDKSFVGQTIGKTFEEMLDCRISDAKLRVKVMVDCREPLRRGISIKLGAQQRKWLSFQYENLPMFCYLCGIMGHSHKDGQDRDKNGQLPMEADLPFGSWLRVGTQPMRLKEELAARNRMKPIKYMGLQGETTAVGKELRNSMPDRPACWVSPTLDGSLDGMENSNQMADEMAEESAATKAFLLSRDASMRMDSDPVSVPQQLSLLASPQQLSPLASPLGVMQVKDLPSKEPD